MIDNYLMGNEAYCYIVILSIIHLILKAEFIKIYYELSGV